MPSQSCKGRCVRVPCVDLWIWLTMFGLMITVLILGTRPLRRFRSSRGGAFVYIASISLLLVVDMWIIAQLAVCFKMRQLRKLQQQPPITALISTETKGDPCSSYITAIRTYGSNEGVLQNCSGGSSAGRSAAEREYDGKFKHTRGRKYAKGRFDPRTHRRRGRQHDIQSPVASDDQAVCVTRCHKKFGIFSSGEAQPTVSPSGDCMCPLTKIPCKKLKVCAAAWSAREKVSGFAYTPKCIVNLGANGETASCD